MKQFLVTILAFVYLTSTVGATLRLDCCLNNLVKAGWIKETKACKDEHKQAKPGQEQKHHNNQSRAAKFFPARIASDLPAYSFHAAASLSEAYTINNTSQHRTATPLFVLNCVYRI